MQIKTHLKYKGPGFRLCRCGIECSVSPKRVESVLAKAGADVAFREMFFERPWRLRTSDGYIVPA